MLDETTLYFQIRKLPGFVGRKTVIYFRVQFQVIKNDKNDKNGYTPLSGEICPK